MAKSDRLAFISGNSNRKMLSGIVRYMRPAPQIIRRELGPFSDGETGVEIEHVVRGLDVFIVQSLSYPQNDHVMEVMLLADALYRSDVKSVSLVVPYLGYSRQDRRPRRERTAIAAKVLADMFKGVGIKRVITVDVHANQIQGFYPSKIPFINVESSVQFLPHIYSNHEAPVIVSPDAGGTERARGLAKQMDYDLAIIDKRRPKANESEVMNIIGDVEGRECVIVDDLIDTGGTLCKGAQALMNHGATKVVAYCAHPVLSGKAIENLEGSVIEKLVVTDTIPLKPKAAKCEKIEVLTMGKVLSEVVLRVYTGQAVSAMYPD